SSSAGNSSRRSAAAGARPATRSPSSVTTSSSISIAAPPKRADLRSSRGPRTPPCAGRSPSPRWCDLAAARPAPARQGDDGDDDEAGEDEAHAGSDAEGVEHGHEQVEEQRGAPDARHVGEAAGHRRAADDDDGNGGEQELLAHVERGPAREAGEQRSAEAGEDGAEDIGGEAHARDADAGEPRRPRV